MAYYDFQITHYGNGDIEMRIYDEPISELTPEEKERRNAKRLASIKLREENLDNVANELSEYYEMLGCDYIPLSESKDGFVTLLTKEEYKEHMEILRKEKNARDSYRRTINAVHDISRSEKWTMFYTLTFSSEFVDRSCFDACMKKANKWFSNLKRKAPDLKYVFVPELHKDGINWHVHGLVCGDNGVDYVDSGKHDKCGRIVYNVDNWRYGWSTATKVDDTRKASSYILKYITKNLCERTLGKKRYYHSRNIMEPIVERFSSNLDFDLGLDDTSKIDFLDTFLASYGVDEVSRIKKVSTEYCSVTYINAHKYESED